MDPLALHLANMFVREAIYRSYRPLSSRHGIWRFLSGVFMPQPSDSVYTYNLKWFVGGLLSGLFMAVWIPLFVFASRSLGMYYTSELLLVSYLILSFLISIIIVFDLIHQVVSSIKEMDILEVVERHPIPREIIEKAASYSLLIGGGLSLLAGMGLSIGLIAYSVTGIVYSIITIPLGFISSMLFIYPIAVIVYRRSLNLSNIVSLIIYVLLVVLTMSIYVAFIGLGDPGQVYETLYGYRWIYPLSFVYLSVVGFDPYSLGSSISFIALSAILSILIPSRYGLKIEKGVSKPRSSRIPISSKGLTLGFKDVLLLIRDRARSKQFYGQMAALMTPSIIPLITPRTLYILSGTEYFHVVFIFTLYGLLSYVLAVIVSPIILFIEGSHSEVLKRLPISLNDLLYGKIWALLLLVQPIALILLIILLLATRDFLIATITYYSFNAYWVMGSFTTLTVVLKILWSSNTAWTELSLGIAKRILVSIASIIPLLLLTPFIFIAYIIDVVEAIIITLLIPLPFLVLALFKTYR